MKTTLVFTFCMGFLYVIAEAGSDLKLNGYAEWKHGDQIIVEGQRVYASNSTKYKGDVKNFASIPLGYEIRVKGERRSDGSILAKELDARPNGDQYAEKDLKLAFDQMEQEYLKTGRLSEGNNPKGIGKLLNSGPEVDRVRKITARIVPPYLKPEDFRVYVVDNNEWNAMASPNRSIFVFSGLLKDMDDDEVAIILGHELVHATHEHSRRQYKKQMWIGLGQLGAQTVTESVVGSGVSSEMVGIATQLGTSAWANGYGREHEDQADIVGLRYAHEGGYDVKKGPGLWAKFAQKYGDQDKVSNFFFGNHSVAKDRQKNLEKELQTNYSNLPQDSGERRLQPA